MPDGTGNASELDHLGGVQPEEVCSDARRDQSPSADRPTDQVYVQFHPICSHPLLPAHAQKKVNQPPQEAFWLISPRLQPGAPYPGDYYAPLTSLVGPLSG